jgi:hypothetical protein
MACHGRKFGGGQGGERLPQYAENGGGSSASPETVEWESSRRCQPGVTLTLLFCRFRGALIESTA